MARAAPVEGDMPIGVEQRGDVAGADGVGRVEPVGTGLGVLPA
jgi:hypothetical protein